MRRSIICFAAAAALMLSGCSVSEVPGGGGVAPSTCGHSEGLVLVLGAHQNAPAPALDQRVECQVAAAIHASKPVLLVVASGQPKVIPTPKLLPVSSASIADQGSVQQQDEAAIKAAVAGARPDSPGADDLAALSWAADAARSAGFPHAQLVLLDSGLDDRGPLDMTGPGMLAAGPNDVVSQLRASGNLPDLHGYSLTLVGTGYTAPPQAPLSARLRSNVTQVWRAVGVAAGAKVEVDPQPAARASVSTSLPVKPVPVPAEQAVQLTAGAPIVFTGESDVQFQPDSTVFVDQAAAAKALQPVAKWLAADRSRHASVVGTTADVDPMAAQVALSQQRAGRVRDQLVALGGSEAQISTSGVGSNFPEFTPDRDSQGNLLPGPATLNRSVRITPSQ